MIQAIHNAPLLTKLVLVEAAIMIADLEDLHASATKLKNVEFLDVGIYASDAVDGDQALYQPAEAVNSFSLTNIRGMLPPVIIGFWDEN